MTKRCLRSLALLAGLLAAARIEAQPACPDRPPSVQEPLEEAAQHVYEGACEKARRPAQQAIERARCQKDERREAEAHWLLGRALTRCGRDAEARGELDQALALFQALGDRGGAGRTYHALGMLAFYEDRPRGRTLFETALVELDAAGDRAGRGAALADRMHVLDDAAESKRAVEEALAIADELRDDGLRARALHRRAVLRDGDGDFAGALEDLNRALTLAEATQQRYVVAGVLTSLGRLYRIHGDPERALVTHRRALAIRQQIGDVKGLISSTNVIGTALAFAGRPREALRYYKRAEAMARVSGGPTIHGFQRLNLAHGYRSAGQPARAIPILEDLIAHGGDRAPGQLAGVHYALGLAEAALGRHARAVENLESAASTWRSVDDPEMLLNSVAPRLQSLRALQRPDEALAAAREGLELTERLRRRLVPRDFLKRGFGERTQGLHADIVALLFDLGRFGEALEVSEQARARALLDLLAAPRGGKAEAEADLVPGRTSAATADAAPLSDIVATARRLDSTVVEYFVAPSATYVWTVSPSGDVHAARVNAGEARRRALGEGACRLPLLTPRGRGGIPTRAGALLSTRTRLDPGWRALYDLLVRPIAAHLPAAEHRLTVVPHGPLLRLPFAALQDERGRYLLERFSLSYTPACGLLDLAARKRESHEVRDRQLLVVADPSPMPTLDSGAVLPGLPGAGREAKAVATAFGAETSARILSGRGATKDAVRRLAGDATLLHFATHGIVLDDRPLASFLAVAQGGAGEDGRLTMEDIDGLSLNADLVVLSACRSALGRLSPDGVLGLTRSFFAAGVSSVMASVWDVADEPTALLVEHFYRHLAAGLPRDRALRQAQRTVLEQLRAGRVRVDTPGGTVVLPETPIFWAGFILIGEP